MAACSWHMGSGLVVALVFALGWPAVSYADGQREGLAHVIVEGIHVGPAKRGGTKWDGGGKLGAKDLKAMTSAASELAQDTLDPTTIVVTKAVDALAEIALRSAKGTEPPDPRGTAALYVNAKQVGASISLPIVRDTFAPHWPDKMAWQHVPLNEDVRIRLVLFDSDDANRPQSDDQLATIVVNSSDMKRAARNGRVLVVYVGDQSDNQIVAVKLTVMLEAYGSQQASEAVVETSAADANVVDAKDVEAFVAFFNRFVDAVVAAKDECGKMTANVNALIDASPEVIKMIGAAKKAKKGLPQQAKDQMIARVREMAPAMKKCGAHPDFRATMKRMEINPYTEVERAPP